MGLNMYRRKIAAIFLIFILALCSCCACQRLNTPEFGTDNKKILAYVLSKTNDSFFVLPEDNSEAKQSGEIFIIPFSKLSCDYEDIEADDYIEILYDGFLNEIIPSEFNAVYQMEKSEEDFSRISEDSISEGRDRLTELFIRAGYPVGEYGMNEFLNNVIENKSSSCVFYRYTENGDPVYYYIDYIVENILGPRFHMTVDFSKTTDQTRYNEVFDFDYMFYCNQNIVCFGECLDNNIKNEFTLLDDDETFNIFYSGLFVPTDTQNEKITEIIKKYNSEERPGLVKYNPSGNAKIELNPGDESLRCTLKTKENYFELGDTRDLGLTSDRDYLFEDINCFLGALWEDDNRFYVFALNEYSLPVDFTIYAYEIKDGTPILCFTHMGNVLPKKDDKISF